MWVKYFIPEDGDDQNHPNVYQLTLPSPPPTTITLSLLKEVIKQLQFLKESTYFHIN